MVLGYSKKLNTNFFNVVKISTLIYYLASSYCWIIGLVPDIRFIIIPYILIIGGYLMWSNASIPKQTNILAIFAALNMYFIWTLYITHNISTGISNIILYLPAFGIYLLNKSEKKDILDFIIKWFSIILVISLLIYFLTFFVKLPSVGRYIAEGDFYKPFDNYIFYIKQTLSIDSFFRFNGPLREPGHLAIMISFLLFAKKYEIKNNKYLWILIICLILTFSLAGWVLTVIGYYLVNLRLKPLLLFTGIIGLTYIIATNYNNGNNTVNNLIIERLAFDEEKGIKGNNRFAKSTDDFYSKQVSSGKILEGVGDLHYSKKFSGAGYKIFFLRYGVISAVLVLFIYIALIAPNCDRWYATCFILLIVLCFLQRAYPHWFSWLLPFVIGTSEHTKSMVKYKI